MSAKENPIRLRMPAPISQEVAYGDDGAMLRAWAWIMSARPTDSSTWIKPKGATDGSGK